MAPAQRAVGEISTLNDLSSRRGLIRVRFVPRFRQVHPTLFGGRVPSAAEVKNLAKRGRVVAVLSEQLGQCYHIGQLRAQKRGVVGDARLIRPQPGEKRRAAGIADGILGVSVLKADPARRQPIDVGSMDRLIAITAQMVSEIVRDDEEDIERRFGEG